MMNPSMTPVLYSKGDARNQAVCAGFCCDVVEALAPFDYGHLPPHLQEVSKHFFELAFAVASLRGNDCQTMMALHYLLIAKDAAVRAENNA